MLSTLYILIPRLLASDRFCFYREDKPKFCTMGGIDVTETFLVLFIFSKNLVYILLQFLTRNILLKTIQEHLCSLLRKLLLYVLLCWYCDSVVSKYKKVQGNFAAFL